MRMRAKPVGRLLALVAVLALTLAACGGDDDAPDSPEPVDDAEDEDEDVAEDDDDDDDGDPAEESADGGTLNVGLLDDIQRWDSSRLQAIFFPVHRNLYDTLIDYVDGLNPEPQLATDWAINDDQDAVDITLREGVLFHSGREMTAEDIALNLEVFADPETGNQAHGPMAVVADWEVTGDYELTVNFTQPIAELQITDLLASWAIGDPEFFDAYETEGNGTGPFKLAEWVPGESITLEAHTDYWGEGPFLDALEYRIFGDSDAMNSALESGVVDYIHSPDALTADRLEQTGDFTVIAAPPGAIIDQWRINPMEAPFDNENVRLAINFASDMDAINAVTNAGLGTPLRLPYAPESPAYDDALAGELQFDLDRAEQLLQDSGVPESEWNAAVLVASNNTQAQQAAQILQEALAGIGFTLEIEQRESGEYTERLLSGGFEILWGGIGNAQKYPTRITTNSIYRTDDNPVFPVEEVFPEYVEAVAAANAAVTPEEQEEAFEELNRVLTERMWVVTGIARPMISLAHVDVDGAYKDIDAQERFNLTRLNR